MRSQIELPNLINCCETIYNKIHSNEGDWVLIFQDFMAKFITILQDNSYIISENNLFIASLNDILYQSENALKNSDYLYLADLMLFEIKPKLEEIKNVQSKIKQK